MRTLAYRLYLVFVVSWFLHMPTRIPPLGLIRADMMLLALISLLIFFSKPEDQEDGVEVPKPPRTKTEKILAIMFIYIIVSLPFVQWPGSVLFHGLPEFTKAVVFYFFSINLLTTEDRLKTFMKVFLTCQTLRVIEPVVLHLTTGYWGSVAHMDNWEFMDRLSGAPSDVVNPNGLAFIIVMVFPFLHYLTAVSWKNKVIYVLTAPVLVYALLLTASRTGFVCLMVILGLIWWRSQRKMTILVVLGISAFVAFGFMTADLKDRYLSIVSKNTNNASTAEGRMTGFKEDVGVAMRKPFVGHGIGCSEEANANYGSYGMKAHNLIAEILEELGFIGLFIFIALVKSIAENFRESLAVMKSRGSSPFIRSLTDGMQVWFFMNLVFSLASFGLSDYEWYLFAGLSIVLRKIVEGQAAATEPTAEPAGGDPLLEGFST